MKTIQYSICCLFLIITTMSCNDDDDANSIDNATLLFGQFHGFCVGDGCIQIFKLEETQLLEDSNDNYPTATAAYNGSFTALSTAKFDLVKDLINDFPADLLNETETTLGCPDCIDQGGYYIEYIKDGNSQFWNVDTERSSVPQYLHNFLDKIDAKMSIINN